MSELLRIATAGSVDDGKSTLIGRLLYDSKAIFEDQLEAVESTSLARGQSAPDLSLLTDGLRAEREQGITIDVAYRYFATPRRKFIIADTPGHIQYTRNMVTGASTATVALILIDARNGVVEQSRRHAFLASLLGIPHLVVCVNKMDLVDYSHARFEEIRSEFAAFASKLEVHDISFVPVSALTGDNVVSRSEMMDWYEGNSLLHQLEEIHIASDRNLVDTRFPVQYVIRPQKSDDAQLHDFRGYAGTVAGGSLRPGDPIAVLPSGLESTVTAVWGPGGRPLDQAVAGQSVTVEIAGQIDIGRGDMLCRPKNLPHSAAQIDAMLCWLGSESSLKPGGQYAIKHTTTDTMAVVERLDYRLDINTLHRETDADSLSLNEIGRVRIATHKSLQFDSYRRNRTTGSFVLLDTATNATVAAGMIVREAQINPDVVWSDTSVSRAERATTGMTVWLTGLSGSGKSAVAGELERRLIASGQPAYILDGDNLRHGISAGLGFSAEDRAENIRRVGEVARLLAEAGVVAIASVVSPYRADRARARTIHDDAELRFLEVFVDTPIEICEARDPKGLYAKARAGQIPNFTGVNDSYERPENPDVRLTPDDGSPAAQAARIIEAIGRGPA